MAEDASLEWLPKKNKLSQSCSVFTTLRYTVLDTWSIGIFLRITPTPCIFASYSGASSCEMDCHWGVALRKVLYQEWCVSTRKTWTLHLSLTSFFLWIVFRPGKSYWVTTVFRSLYFLMWGHLKKEWLCSFLYFLYP